MDLLEAGILSVNIHKVYPIADAKTAHDDLEGNLLSSFFLVFSLQFFIVSSQGDAPQASCCCL